MRKTFHRGLSLDDSEYVYGNLVVTPEGPVIRKCIDKYFIDTTMVDIFVHPDSIGEYTGSDLQDAKDTQIYEGMTLKAYKHGDKETPPHINKVTWRNGTFWFGNWTWIEFLNVFRYVEIVE